MSDQLHVRVLPAVQDVQMSSQDEWSMPPVASIQVLEWSARVYVRPCNFNPISIPPLNKTQFNWVESGLPAVRVTLVSNPNLQIGAVYAHADAMQVLWWRQGAALLWTLHKRGTSLVHPQCVHFRLGGVPKLRRVFVPKTCSALLLIFTLLECFVGELLFLK